MIVNNWKGEPTEAPPDLPTVVDSFHDGYIVWSRDGRRHQVRYGLQAIWTMESLAAAAEVGRCLHHFAECVRRKTGVIQ